MRICHTGYCGHPCTCPESYTHMDRGEAETLRDICIDHVSKLDTREASEKHGEPMVPYDTVEVHLTALRIDGEIYKVHHLLNLQVIRPDDQRITTTSGILTVIRDQDTFKFVAGADSSNRNTVHWEVLKYHNDVSVSIECTGGIGAAYAKLTPSKIYLPE